jgi:hypothetical protein
MHLGRRIALMAAAIAVLAAVVGCGGGSGSVSSDSSADPATANSGSSKEFIKPGSESNKYAEFGSEADAAEREAASRALSRSLQARAAGEWGVQCTTIATALIKEIQGGNLVPGNASCAKLLKALAEPLASTRKVRADTLDGTISVLRVKWTRAYALYHGSDQKNYAMPMKKEHGGWKVNSLQTTELP